MKNAHYNYLRAWRTPLPRPALSSLYAERMMPAGAAFDSGGKQLAGSRPRAAGEETADAVEAQTRMQSRLGWGSSCSGHDCSMPSSWRRLASLKEKRSKSGISGEKKKGETESFSDSDSKPNFKKCLFLITRHSFFLSAGLELARWRR